MPNMSRKQVLKLCASLALLPLAGCAKPRESGYAQRTGFFFNTVCTMGGNVSSSVLDEAEDLCKRFEQLFSRTIATSDVARVNTANGAAVEVDPLTAELVGLSLAYCEESGGLFDITIGAVSELWDFVEGVVPDPAAIANALPHVGYKNVHVQDNTVQLLDPQARIDLGGIAKGYIADKLVELFVQLGAQDVFVNLGGNVKVLGHNDKGAPWSVGVRDPQSEDATRVVARILTSDGSVVTSGLYERSFERDGRRYWHILDPRTGYPVQTDIASASIYSVASIDGDGYTKPLFMMKHEDALAFVQARGNLQALLVTSDGSILTTPGSDFELLS